MTRILTILVLILCVTSTALAELEENTVLLYLFDEEAGDEATDLSPMENHGELTDAEWTEDGKNGGGLIFNGTSSLIEIPHHESLLPGGDEMTIEAWFKPATFPAGHPPIARKGAVAESGWGFDTPGGTIRGFVYTAPGDPAVAQGASTMKLDTWHHLALVYDGAEVRVYLDGEEDGKIERKGNINENQAPVWIGKKANENVWLDGVLDELRILNIALTQKQIQQDMEGISFAVEAKRKLAVTWGQLKAP